MPERPQRDPADALAAARTAEMEELQSEQVVRRRPSRIGLVPVIAGVAIVVLLATGLGVLGGRPTGSVQPPASPRASDVTVAGTLSPSPFPGTPIATPWIECGPDPERLPVIDLESDGARTPGLVEVASGPDGATPAAAQDPFASIRGPAVTVRPDVITELWIDDGACALEWSIEVIDRVTGGNWVLSEARNPTLDPNVAAQNRFNLSAGMAALRHIGHDVQFGGVFVFRTGVHRAFWRLRIEPLHRPTPSVVTGAGEALPFVEGCDIELALRGSGWTEEARPDCVTDLSEPMDGWSRVAPGMTLDLSFDGWDVQALSVACGRLSDQEFIAAPSPGCFMDLPAEEAFVLPMLSGRWTLALAACASQQGSDLANQVCGTWYVNVEIVASSGRP